MPNFVKKLAKKAADKAINKLTDKVFGSFKFGKASKMFGFGGARQYNPTTSERYGVYDYRSHFHNMLTGADTKAFQTPNRSLWFVVIDPFPQALNLENLQTLECGEMVDDRGPGKHAHYDMYDDVKNNITSQSYQNQQGGKSQSAGCLFAQGVNLPTEQMSVQRVSVENNRGFIPGLVAGARGEFNPLSIEFRETNASFVDTVIRPWVTLASHYGFVARGMNDPKNIKTNITVTQLGINGHQNGPYIRKQMVFHNCVPFQIAQQQYTYDTDAGAMNPIDVQWQYTHYSIDVSGDVSKSGATSFKSGIPSMSDLPSSDIQSAINTDTTFDQFTNGNPLDASSIYGGGL